MVRHCGCGGWEELGRGLHLAFFRGLASSVASGIYQEVALG